MKRYLSLWILCLLGGASPMILGSMSESEIARPIHVLDRQLQALKTKLSHQFASRSTYPINIVRLQYPDSIEFWLDSETHKKITKSLEDYPGPIIFNLSPNRLAKTAEFKPLLEKENFIRPFVIAPGLSKTNDKEQVLNSRLEGELSVSNRLISIHPETDSYYDTKYYFGSLGYQADQFSRSIVSFSWLSPGGAELLPNAMLSAYQFMNQCQVLYQNEMLSCGDREKSDAFPSVVDMYFYKKFFPSTSDLRAIRNSGQPLILHVDTGVGKFMSLAGRPMDWAELSATALSNLIQKDFWKPSFYLSLLEKIFVLLFFIVFSIFVFRTDLRRSLTVALLFLGVFIVGDLFLTIWLNWRSYPIDEILSIFLLGLTGVSLRGIVDAKERSLIERAFRGYVSDDRLTELLKGRETLKLAGKRQKLTVMMVDIRGFSKLAEELSAEDVFKILHKIFDNIDSIILSHGGVIDKKLGDGLLCFFGDSAEEGDAKSVYEASAQNAVNAAVDIQENFKKLNFDEFSISQPVMLRIGINSGEVVLGNAGSQYHFDYTVLGHNVNFSQRLEAACEPGNILMGEETEALVSCSLPIKPKSFKAKNDSRDHKGFEIQIP